MIYKAIIQKFHQYGIKQFLHFFISEIRIRYINPFFFHSYSQFGEDQWMDTYFHYKRKGCYVDIGAYDPFRFSNTMRFYKKGWRGITIEPNTELWKKFIRCRPEDRNCNIGVGRMKSTSTFYRIDPPTLSTFSYKQAIMYQKQGFRIMEKVSVQVLPLRNVLHKYLTNKIIDFLSIDVEGLEMDVLRGNDWKNFRPTVICIETSQVENKGDATKIKKIKQFLESLDYWLAHQTPANSLYVSKR